MKRLTFLLLFLSLFALNSYSQDDARSYFPDRIFFQSDFDTPGDSCSVLNPERHDDFTHENGYRQSVGDSTRMVIKMRPASYPWTYTNVCIGWTASGGNSTLMYNVVVYDSAASGPGNLLFVSADQPITGIPNFPAMQWYSTTISVTVNSGAIYVGARWTSNPTYPSRFMSADQTPPLWPGYLATVSPPTWTPIQNTFATYTCMCIRTEGRPAAPVGCSRYYTQWCPAATFANIPAPTLYNACAWIGDTLYMHSPDATGTATTLINRYSLSGNAWTVGVPLPVAKTQGTLTAAAGKMYFIGGGPTAGGAGTTDVYEYNPATGAWTLKAPIPSPTQGHGAGNWGDSVIFVIMGPWGTPTTTCQFYRIGTNTTGTTTAFTGPARRSHAVGLWGNKIFVAGGFPFTNTFYIGTIGSDASTVTWVAGPPYPSVPKSRIGGVAVADRFYIIGGNNSAGTTSSDSTFIWNITASTWIALGSVKPAAVHNNEAAVTYRCVGDSIKIFCPGGSSQAGTTLNNDVIGCGPTVVGITPVISEIPHEYSLAQNYPNPFNPSTKILYALPKPGIVTLVIYDMLGREVKTLVNEFKNAGRYAVDFDASALSTGVYFYRINAGEFSDTKKMLLIK